MDLNTYEKAQEQEQELGIRHRWPMTGIIYVLTAGVNLA
jgi:hypothetical protein